jgi:hypothetical protein
MPAVSATVNVEVLDSTWASVDQVLFVSGAGHFFVDAVPDSTHLTLENTGYPGNAAPAANIPSGQTVSPAGLKGTDGTSPPASALNDISPTTTRGDLIVDNGANTPDASDVRLPVGTDGQLLSAQSSQPTGLQWQTLLPNASGTTDMVVPRFDTPAGTEEPSPLAASGLLITDDGALQSTPTGGNARGSKAVDLQVDRAAATQVASGAQSAVLGGASNTASGQYAVAAGIGNIVSGIGSVALGDTNVASGATSVALGTGNAASGDQSIALGQGGQASGAWSACLGGTQCIADSDYATALGGYSNLAHGDYSIALGRLCTTDAAAMASVASGYRSTALLHCQRAHSAGPFALPGDAQISDLIWRGSTTDATPTEIFLDGSAIQATVPTDTTWAFSVFAVARRDTGVSVIFKVEGGIKNIGGVVTLVAAITTTVVSDGSGGLLVAGNFVVSADDPNNALIITVTGAGGQNWRWVARAHLVELTY